MRLFAAAVGCLLMQIVAPLEPVRAAWDTDPAARTDALDVAGVRIGMAPAEAAVTLESIGFARASRELGPSWETIVAQRSCSREPVDAGRIIETERYVRGEEEVLVTYAPVPAGAEVSEVAYLISEAAISAEQFSASVAHLYGPPVQAEDSVALYCTAGERRCLFTQPIELPNLVAYSGSPTRSLILHQGNRAMTVREARAAAESARLRSARRIIR